MTSGTAFGGTSSSRASLMMKGTGVSAAADLLGRRHSRWLTMMYPRLVFARNLLRQDGALFVTIDDNEGANLRQLMDEIFGPENFLAKCHVEAYSQSKNNEPYFRAIGIHSLFIAVRRSCLASRYLERKNTTRPIGTRTMILEAFGEVEACATTKPGNSYSITTPTGRVIQPPCQGWR